MAHGDRFIGRENELASLVEALGEAQSGHGRLILLSGEPGIGKTRVAAEVAEAAREVGALALWGRCHEGEGAPAYWPWLQIARAHREHPGSKVGELAQIERQLSESIALLEVSPEQARFELFERASSTLRTVSRDQPLLLVLDDLHWADRSSLKLLQFFARELASSRVLALGTFREIEPSTPPEISTLLGDLARLGRMLPLRGLAETEVAALIADRAGVVPERRLVRSIFEATRGNPFFVDEVVRLLVAERRLSAPDTPTARALPIPVGVRAAISRRLESLDDLARRVLSVAAVCGRDFDVAILERASGVARAAVAEALEVTERLAVVARLRGDVGRYTFSHALVRETLYDELSESDRKAWHRRIGEALEVLHAKDLDRCMAELAHHFASAADADLAAKVVDYGCRAGEIAHRQLAFDEAEFEIDRALRTIGVLTGDTSGRRCQLLAALAEAQRGSGKVDAMTETFRQAVDLARRADAETFANTVLRFSAARWESYFVDELLVGLIEEAIERLDSTPTKLRAKLLARLAAALHLRSGSEARRAALADEATRIARAQGDPSTLAWVLTMRVLALLGPDKLEERLAAAGEVIRLADETGNPVVALEAQTWRVHELLELGDMEAVDLAIATFGRAAERLKRPIFLWHVATWRVMRATVAGRLHEAEGLLGDALAAGQRALQQAALIRYGEQLLMVRWEQGRMRELEGLIRMAADQAPGVPTWQIVIASLHVQNGRFEEAQAEIDAIGARGFVDLPRDANWLFAMVSIAHIICELGDAKHCRQVYDLLLPYAGRAAVTRPAVTFGGTVSHFLGRLAEVLGDLDGALAHLENAMREHRRLRSPAWVARSQVEMARVLLRCGGDGDIRRAVALADEAHAVAAELGIEEILPRSSRLVEQARQAAAGLDALGPMKKADEGLPEVTIAADVRTVASTSAAPPASAASPLPPNSLRCEGDIWTICFEGRIIRERHSIGLLYIAALLERPEHEFTAWDLSAMDGTSDLEEGSPRTLGRVRFGGPIPEGFSLPRDVATRTDAQAVADYRRRLADLRVEGAEADDQHDLGRLDRIEEETRFLESEIMRAVGIGSRPRHANTAAERARLRVTKAIRYAIRKLSAHDRALGEHLDVSIRTGMLCSYAPRPPLSRTWSVS